jgi:hypothetical protein
MERVFERIGPFLTGKTVYVVGGGPSLADFDFSCLKGKPTVGANDAGRLSACDVIVTLDRRYFLNRKEDLVQEARSGKMVCAALPEKSMPRDTTFPRDIVYVHHIPGSGLGLSEDPAALRGLNSGFAAFNLAYLSGASHINLLGFDFRFTPDRPHWHPENSWNTHGSDHQIRRWAREFDATREQLERDGVEVINYIGPQGSEISAFQQRPLEELEL